MRFKNIDFKKNFSDALKFTVVISMIYFFVNFKYPYTLTYFFTRCLEFSVDFNFGFPGECFV